MVIIILIIIIFILYKLLYVKKGFWVEQPVMRSPSLKWNFMNSLPHFNISIPKDFTLKYDVDCNETVSFIQKYFSNELMMSYDNMLAFISNEKSTNVSLLYKGELCATIHSRPVSIIFDKNEYNINYVEYLCVKPEQRNNNIAAIMIASIINRMNTINNDVGRVYLFKKDGNIHDFIPFASSRYLCYEIEDCYDSDISSADNRICEYEYWKNWSDKHRFSLYIAEEGWSNFIKNKVVYNVESNVIIGQLSQIKKGDKVFDIEYIISVSHDINTIKWSEFYSLLRKQGIKYITINDISNFKEKIPNLSEWKNGNTFQYYLYNAECPIIKKEELFFTIN
jgi:ASC-1-like (ASCH) protein